MSINNEANIIINGYELSVAESMTVRVALNAFMSELEEVGLGDDEHGKLMTEAYIRTSSAILNKIHTEIKIQDGEI